MCGIAGFLTRKCNPIHTLNSMVRTLHRRGPDGSEIWYNLDSGIGMAHTRLSIIDLSTTATQPMHYLDKRYSIVFNGEIYNYIELKQDLIDYGYNFNSNSDTEVILAGWDKWNIKLPNLLRGMFAFAIWDDYEKKLILCRDRFGIKPLLWYNFDSIFLFGSTIDSILASNIVNTNYDINSIFEILSHGSISQPNTIYDNINNLEPGNLMIVKENMPIYKYKYWDILEESKKNNRIIEKLNYSEIVKETRKLFEESCKYHLVSDVPVASFLSGGIDSTSITSMISRISNTKIKTFSVGFDIPHFKNEIKEAKHASDFIGTDHNEIIIESKQIDSYFDDFISIIDQPSNDGANTYFVSKAAAESGIKVALSGLGADEIFGGYPHFISLNKANYLSSNYVQKILSRVHLKFPNKITESYFYKSMNEDERFYSLRREFTKQELIENLSIEILNKSIQIQETNVDFAIKEEFQDYMQKISKYEINHYLLNTLLRDADAIGSGNSIEIRPVILDHKLAEFAFSIPSNYKISNNIKKSLFKDAISDLIPSNLLNKPKKGFNLPIYYWIKDGLKQRILEALESSTAKNIFSRKHLLDCAKNIENANYSNSLWTKLVLITWLEKNKKQIF
jgi:asparagine synthase (glutamine-hydrolysing)